MTKRCEQIQAMLRANKAPEVARDAIDQTLDHLDECEACANVADEQECDWIYQLAEPTATASLDKLLQEQAEDEREIAHVVTNGLLPSLSGEAQNLGVELSRTAGPYALFAATEAVSGLVARHVEFVRPDVQYISLLNDGGVWMDHGVAIPAEETTLEIARFADVWDERERPDRNASLLARWTTLAASQKRHLFEDFDSYDYGGDEVWLVPSPPRGEATTRWATEPRDRVLCFAVMKRVDAVLRGCAYAFEGSPSVSREAVLDIVGMTKDPSQGHFFFEAKSQLVETLGDTSEHEIKLGKVVVRAKTLGNVTQERNKLTVTVPNGFQITVDPILPALLKDKSSW